MIWRAQDRWRRASRLVLGGTLGFVGVRFLTACATGTTASDTLIGESGGTGMGGASGAGGAPSTTVSSSSAGTGSCDATCAPGLVDLDGDPATGMCGCEYACVKKSDIDLVDPAFIDENCDGSDGVVAECVYVSKSHGAPGGDGSRSAPVDTLAAGVAVALKLALPAVCIGGSANGETYDGSVTLPSGLSIYGGFDAEEAAFAFRRSPAVTTTLKAAGTVVLVPAADSEMHVEGLTLHALTPSVPGASAYGVRALGGLGMLFVRYDTITVDKGAVGAAGAAGAAMMSPQASNGAAGSNGCTGSNCGTGGAQGSCPEYGGKGGDGGYDSGTGNAGSPGSGGSPVGAGGDWSGCFGGGHSGKDGGAAAGVGASGSAGGHGNSLGSIVAGLYAGAAGGDGTSGKNGKGGSGGGGGGGGDDAGIFCKSDKGGGGGAGGCGGLGGDLGRGGKGGGASFGVFVVAGKVTVAANVIETAGGGVGGYGGDGGVAQHGGAAGGGGSGADDGGTGGQGGAGSNGGHGGPAGGGGGGPSACVAQAVPLAVNSGNTCKFGVGGLGGKGGTNVDTLLGEQGLTGLSGAALTFP